ncbi:MAG: hypothetical protein M3261_03140 [Thermoproteota archaeon]|nr:hypothetical protein [Thermoproteota archaeon]
MVEKNWQTLRENGFRTLFVGAFALVIAFIIYSRLTTPSSELMRIASQQLTGLAWGMLAITAASMASILHGIYIIFQSERIRTTTAASSGPANSLISFIITTFSNRNYWKIMIAATIAYGIFFGFLSQILVYRADVSFTERGIKVPSIDLIPCCATAGYMPMATFYITDHFLILIIPLNVILATIVSLLVGFNVALSIFAFRLKKSLQTKTSFAAGIGATSGLFVGCPTCAGSLFSALLGVGIAGAGGTSASVLAPFQTLFIAVSIPALLIAPFLMARSIRSSISSCDIT